LADSVNRFLLERIRSAHPSGRILDIPAGRGVLSRLFDEAGFDVTPADLFPEALNWEGRKAIRADMNAPLPFAAAAFDVVVSQEGVEHLENLALFFRECRRVLRPAGSLWITTPNFLDLSSRLAFFLTGMKSFHAGFPNEDSTLWGREGDRLYHGHAFTLTYFQIRYLLRVVGFREVRLWGLGSSPASKGLYWLVRPISGALVGHALARLRRKSERRGKHPPASDDLARQLKRESLSRELLCHRKICIKASV
jgi:SAM-dependent methyltransferase